MTKSQINLLSLLLWSGAVPIWIFVTVVVSQSVGFRGSSFRYLLSPVVLSGIAIAIHRLFRGNRNALAISVFLAGVIAIATLTVAAALENRP